jgi:anaerobic ribonucleoside-triphosphate reductase activating protein
MRNLYGTQFNISHIEPVTHIYGPGSRFAVWMQGCSLACKGCWNQQMWSFKENKLYEREALLQQILNASDIEGITLLGGEPLEQADNTLWLLIQIKKQSDLTIVLYTGLTKTELISAQLWDTLEANVDLLITGRYQEQDRNIHNQWYGSDNQQLIYPEKSQIKQASQPVNEVEIIIEPSGEIRTLGYPGA